MTLRPLASSDRPLVDPAEDLLGFDPFCRHVAQALRKECPADGLVVAIHAPWGAGKSTALNFIEHYLRHHADNEEDARSTPLVVRFNPWWFSSPESVASAFFEQLHAAVSSTSRLPAELGRVLQELSELIGLLPIEGVSPEGKAIKALFGQALKAIGKAAGRKRSASEAKAALSKLLALAPMRIVIVIDDIDRLVADEVQSLFRVVKAIGDLPNVIYLLAFDRFVVAGALDSLTAGKGNAYLDKIVQVQLDLPLVDRAFLTQRFLSQLDKIVVDPAVSPDSQEFGNLFVEGVEPLLLHPRDVVRLLNALTVTYPALRNEVHPIDLLGIETLRIFCPGAYCYVRDNEELFACGDFDSGNRNLRTKEAEFLQEWLKQLGHEAKAAERLLRRLFPRFRAHVSDTNYSTAKRKTWRKELRICEPQHFHTYFGFGPPPGRLRKDELSLILAGTSSLMSSLVRLAAQRRPDGTSKATDLLDYLRSQDAAELTEEFASALFAVLADVGDTLGDNPTRSGPLGFFTDDKRIELVAHKALQAIVPQRRMTMLSEAIDTAVAVGTLARLVLTLAHERGKYGGDAEKKPTVASDDDLEELKNRLRARIRREAAASRLLQNRRMSLLLNWWLELAEDEARAWAQQCAESLEGLLIFLRTAIVPVRTSTMDDSVDRIRKEVQIDGLMRVFDKAWLIERAEDVLAGKLAVEDREDLVLVVRFLRNPKLSDEDD